jgi:hypothetical protein
MKIFTPDGSELMTIETVEATEAGIVIGGRIMGAMPMKGVIRPAELKSGRRFLTFALIRRGVLMLFGR